MSDLTCAGCARLNVFPVYWFGLLGDAFFANAIDFWGGSNPITVRIEPKTVVGPDGGVAQLVRWKAAPAS